jgi:hypothetical protein
VTRAPRTISPSFSFRQAAEGGDASGAFHYGLELEKLGREQEALSWFFEGHARRAAEVEWCIADLLEKQGRNTEAEEWRRKAEAAEPDGLLERLPRPPDSTKDDDPDTVKE